jgi:hypothetical protein
VKVRSPKSEAHGCAARVGGRHLAACPPLRPAASFAPLRWFGAGVLSRVILLLADPALALDTNKIPELKPPLPPLPPSWWELHLWSVIGTVLVVFAVSMALVRLFFRPRIARELLPEAVARAALEQLRAAPESEATAAEAGRQLRRFTQAALALPAGELTTDETLRALAARPSPPPEPLVQELGSLLRECDARHFAPQPPPGQPALADRALAVMAQIESFRRPAVQTGSPVEPPKA